MAKKCKKACFPSSQVALQRMKEINKQSIERFGSVIGLMQGTYLCEKCDAWHLTSKKSWKGTITPQNVTENI